MGVGRVRRRGGESDQGRACSQQLVIQDIKHCPARAPARQQRAGLGQAAGDLADLAVGTGQRILRRLAVRPGHTAIVANPLMMRDLFSAAAVTAKPTTWNRRPFNVMVWPRRRFAACAKDPSTTTPPGRIHVPSVTLGLSTAATPG